MRDKSYKVDRKNETPLIKARIASMDITMKSLAIEYGCSLPHMSMVINGRQNSSLVLDFLEEKLGMTLPLEERAPVSV